MKDLTRFEFAFYTFSPVEKPLELFPSNVETYTSRALSASILIFRSFIDAFAMRVRAWNFRKSFKASWEPFFQKVI
jgi:hypothetical protein